MESHSQKIRNNAFIFREAANTDELLELLKLRYRVYRDSRVSGFVKGNPYSIDLDPYDLRARHFGLFRYCDSLQQPVGYLRVVEDRRSPKADQVLEIASHIRRKTDLLEDKRLYPFPLMEHYPGSNILWREYNALRNGGERLLEAGRLALDTQCRSSHMARHIIESALAIYFVQHRYENAIWCCYSSCAGIYKRLYGLRAHKSENREEFLKFGRASICLIGRPAWLPDKIKGKLDCMAWEYAQSGCVRYPVRTTARPLSADVNRATAVA